MFRDSRALVIDDVDDSLSRLSTIGQEILRDPVEVIREAVYHYADRYSLRIVRHKSFVRFAEEYSNCHLEHWLVLDPLFVPMGNPERFTRIRTSRQHDFSIPKVRFDRNLTEMVREGRVGILDDAASSGRTLRSVITSARSIGLRVSTVLLCASSRSAYHHISTSVSISQWREFVPGDWEVMHLRDGFPFLPFAGRPTGHVSIEVGIGEHIDVRVSSAHSPGNPWQVIQRDRAVGLAIRQARGEVGKALSRSLGRPATVADLQLLGSDANVFVDQNMAAVTKDVVLDDIDQAGVA